MCIHDARCWERESFSHPSDVTIDFLSYLDAGGAYCECRQFDACVMASLRAGQRAAAVMSLIQSAKLNGHDPYAYLKDVFLRLPTHPHSRIDELLPHYWRPLA